MCVCTYITHAQTKLLDILLALCSVHSASTLFTTSYILLFHYFKIEVSNKKQTEHLVLDVPFMTSDFFWGCCSSEIFRELSKCTAALGELQPLAAKGSLPAFASVCIPCCCRGWAVGRPSDHQWWSTSIVPWAGIEQSNYSAQNGLISFFDAIFSISFVW